MFACSTLEVRPKNLKIALHMNFTSCVRACNRAETRHIYEFIQGVRDKLTEREQVRNILIQAQVQNYINTILNEFM